MPVAASTYLPLAPPFEPQPPGIDWGNRKFDCVADQSMPLFTTDPRGYLPQIYLPQLMGQQGWDIPTMGSSYTPMLPIHADNSLHETNQLLSPTGPLNSPFTNTGPYSNSPGTEDLQHPGDTSVFRVGDTSIPDTIPASEDPFVVGCIGQEGAFANSVTFSGAGVGSVDSQLTRHIQDATMSNLTPSPDNRDGGGLEEEFLEWMRSQTSEQVIKQKTCGTCYDKHRKCSGGMLCTTRLGSCVICKPFAQRTQRQTPDQLESRQGTGETRPTCSARETSCQGGEPWGTCRRDSWVCVPPNFSIKIEPKATDRSEQTWLLHAGSPKTANWDSGESPDSNPPDLKEYVFLNAFVDETGQLSIPDEDPWDKLLKQKAPVRVRRSRTRAVCHTCYMKSKKCDFGSEADASCQRCTEHGISCGPRDPTAHRTSSLRRGGQSARGPAVNQVMRMSRKRTKHSNPAT